MKQNSPGGPHLDKNKEVLAKGKGDPFLLMYYAKALAAAPNAHSPAWLSQPDPRLPLDRHALDAALADKQAFTGAAGDQVDRVVDAVDELVGRYPEAAKYTSGAIL